MRSHLSFPLPTSRGRYYGCHRVDGGCTSAMPVLPPLDVRPTPGILRSRSIP
ncbi:hypothetical protein BDQ94DRAFT_146452 [Aspergillus welwitschiae]|uniref:Uncharacterized protein n=1 Tax=Aspergillus welwitschiae TaxID=1341132 RepID=A0A3F3PXS0_9EURO|nr:hypothetical protein BDQ94DRAFT_146452 [Aspergillus welwitschiae]RDH31685.1 hypothetical protein BDQ94DRAFT_146452 [Aspergillus welwitschiae]